MVIFAGEMVKYNQIGSDYCLFYLIFLYSPIPAEIAISLSLTTAPVARKLDLPLINGGVEGEAGQAARGAIIIDNPAAIVVCLRGIPGANTGAADAIVQSDAHL